MSKIYDESGRFIKNIGIDAEMLAYANKYGIAEIFTYQQMHQDIFKTPQAAVDRIKWYSNQKKDYKTRVALAAKKLITNKKV